MATNRRGDADVEITATDKTAEGLKSAQRNLQNLASSTAILDGPLSAVSGRISALSAALGRVNPAMIAWGTAAAGTVVLLKQSLTAYAEFESQLFRLEAQLKATGGASGESADSINRMAEAIGTTTLATVSQVREASSALLGLNKVSGEVFETTLSLGQDFTAVFGGQLTENVLRIGKALQDPAASLEGLSEKLGKVDEGWKSNVINMFNAGKQAEAQHEIIRLLMERIGGAGTAESAGLAGATQNLADKWAIFNERLSESSGIGQNATGVLGVLAGVVDKLTRAVTSDTDLDFYDRQAQMLSRLKEATENYTKTAKNNSLDEATRNKQLTAQYENILKIKQDIRDLEEERDPTLAANRIAAGRNQEEAARKAKEQAEAQRRADMASLLADRQIREGKDADKKREQVAKEYDAIVSESMTQEERLRAVYLKRAEFISQNSDLIKASEAEKYRVLTELGMRYVEDVESLNQEKTDRDAIRITSELAQVSSFLNTEEQQLEASYLRRSDIVAQALARDIVSQDQAQQMMLDLSKKYEEERTMISRQAEFERTTVALQASTNIIGALTSLTSIHKDESDKQFNLWKKFAILEATGNTLVAFTKALAQGGILGYTAAAAILASGMARVHQISKLTPSSSGVGGGSGSLSSERVPQYREASPYLPKQQSNVNIIIGGETVATLVVDGFVSAVNNDQIILQDSQTFNRIEVKR